MCMCSELFTRTSKLSALARAGRIGCARQLFDEMSQRDLVAWNAMISGYSHLGLHNETLSLFSRMRTSDISPDHFTLTATLTACAGSRNILCGTKIHGLVTVFGYGYHVPVCNSLIDMYGKCLRPCDASKVFEDMNFCNEITWCSVLFAHVNSGWFGTANEVFRMMPQRVQIAWNIMIAGYAKYGEFVPCLELFKEMRASLFQPDQWTLSSLMNGCAESLEFDCGRMLHCFIVKSGWGLALESMNSILSFYAKLGCGDEAMKPFQSFETLNVVSSNAIIDAHLKAKDTEKAFLAFEQAPEKNVVSWTSMITGFARNGNCSRALTLFVNMIRNRFIPDALSFGAALHACSSLTVLCHGEMIHGCIVRHGLHANVYVGNGLINMYAKCGKLEGSLRAFDEITNKDIVSWNTMIFAFGLHGLASHTLQLFEDMLASGMKPDKVSFIGLLITCSHSGLLEKGGELFKSMEADYGVSHDIDHLVCMVDMLGRGGFLGEAQELARENWGTSMCEALLGACSTHMNIAMGIRGVEGLKELEPHKEMSYVVLSNMYCYSGKWKEAEMVRKTMTAQGVKKMPGCSWIEVSNIVTAFVSGNNSHPYMEDFCKILHVLDCQMRSSSSLTFWDKYNGNF